MTWAGFVWRNLWRRPARTTLTAAGVAIGVGLIVALLSIAAGVRKTAGDLIHIGRADFGVFQESASDLTRSLLPETLGEKIEGVEGVDDVAGIFLRVGEVEGRKSTLVFGYAPDEFPARRLVVVAGRRPQGNEALVGDAGARTLELEPGDMMDVEGRRFRVSGLYHSGNRFVDSGVVLPLAAVQRIAGRPGEVTTFGVIVSLGRPPEDVAELVERRIPGAVAVTEPGAVVKVDTSSRLIIDAGWIFSVMALIVGGIGVMNTMAMSVIERIQEIGLMRAVGWRKRRIALLILSEATGIGLIALALGLSLGYLAAELFTSQGNISRLAEPDFTAGVFAWGLAFALGVALIGALYPAWRAVSLRPIEALRRE
ncbi:MAG TPA: ABC transporter permease [Gaiellaceae bacterium]|nr:ABC transporter permease [Gaiellaceae bacterium]